MTQMTRTMKMKMRTETQGCCPGIVASTTQRHVHSFLGHIKHSVCFQHFRTVFGNENERKSSNPFGVVYRNYFCYLAGLEGSINDSVFHISL